MTRRTDEAIREKIIELVNGGLTKCQVAKELGIGATTVSRIAKHVGKTFSYYSEEVKTDVLNRIAGGQSAASVARDCNIDKALICVWQKKAKGIKRIRNDIGEDTKREAIRLVESGLMYTAVSRRLKVSAAAVRYWFQQAEAAGLAVMPDVSVKRADRDLTWVQRMHPNLEEWRGLAVEWLRGEHNSRGSKVASLAAFFTRYLSDLGLPVAPEEILRRGTVVPDFFKTACPQSSGGISYNNHIHYFIEWVLLHRFSLRADDGVPVISSAFRNPVPKLTRAGFPMHYESVQTPLPYGFISDLRRLLVTGPNFNDWTWAQNALGVKRSGEISTRMSMDWFVVTEDQIDKNDPDCVWRIRHSLDRKVKPLLEMWSPVRWVALLIKLQLPPRTFQVRMLDSGEGDTWRYVEGSWVLNSCRLSKGTIRAPARQGVLRRIESIGRADAETTLYFNTNKTADIRRASSEKGYEFPWPALGGLQDQPHYWLEKMRNWQEKYNPLLRPTAWRDIPPRCIGVVKSDIQLMSYPDTYFLFRTAERRKEGESHLPISDGTLSGAWGKLLEEMQKRLANTETTHADGSPIVLVTRPGNSPIASFPLHSLRVSLITALAIDGGLPFHLLVKLAGHSRLIMTLYYTKPGFEHMKDALLNAAERIDAVKEKSIISFLANQEHSKLMEWAIFNSLETLESVVPEYPVNRNPAGWMLMHHGVCLVGGNNLEMDLSSNKGGFKLGGCYNGGPAFNSNGDQRVHQPVPGGPRNCIRCRWFVTEPHYVPALAAHLGNIGYRFDEARNSAIRQDAVLQGLKKEKAETENRGEMYADVQRLRVAERIWEATMHRFSSLAEDMAACWRLIQRCNAVQIQPAANGTVLIAVGSTMDVQARLEEVDSELLQLSGVCQNLEIYPDLESGKAIFRRSQLLDAALSRERMPPVFLQLSEEEQLKAGNAFVRRLAAQANQNPLVGLRQICTLVDAGESLSDFMGVDVGAVLGDVLRAVPIPVRLGLDDA